MTRPGFALVVVLAVGAIAGCTRGAGDIDRTIGAACTSDTQCDHRCLQGPSYPMGFCSTTCSSDNQCPAGAVCAMLNGGVCLFDCANGAFNCGRLGAGYTCQLLDAYGAGSKVNVCAGM